MFQDRRFKEWKINRTLFEKKLLSLEFPLKFDAILLTALDEYFKESKASIRIHKADSVIDNWKEINELFPNSKSIYIVRDPRAIFRSQIEMLEILNNKNKNHIYGFITAYKSRSKLVKNYFTDSNFLLVKYEDLINNKKSVIDKILSFIELDNQQKKNSHNNYLNKIPYYERPIHTNINSEPLHANINKWENALNPWTISIIEKMLQKEMKYFSYSTMNINLEMAEKKQYYKLLWKYLIFSIKRIVVNILKYFRVR